MKTIHHRGVQFVYAWDEDEKMFVGKTIPGDIEVEGTNEYLVGVGARRAIDEYLEKKNGNNS